METTYEVLSAVQTYSPPTAKMRVVDPDGNKYIVVSVTFHPEQSYETRWSSIDIIPDPEG